MELRLHGVDSIEVVVGVVGGYQEERWEVVGDTVLRWEFVGSPEWRYGAVRSPEWRYGAVRSPEWLSKMQSGGGVLERGWDPCSKESTCMSSLCAPHCSS